MPRQLNTPPIAEVHLSRAPLERVIAQVRFPTILAIRDPDRVAVFQEAIREHYPVLNNEQIHSVDLSVNQTPNIRQDVIWRFADNEKSAAWRVSLGVDFVSLETTEYHSRTDFLDRLDTVISSVQQYFEPATASRIGLRYIDRIIDDAFERIGEMVQPSVLGILTPYEVSGSELGNCAVQILTEAQFLAEDGARIQGRWGKLPASASYDQNILQAVGKQSWILDLDMFTEESQPFESKGLQHTASGFSESIYALFREIVTDEFLRYYGGNP